MNKTFRGQLKALGQETIRLSTNNGLSGYRITRLQIIPIQPGALEIQLY